MHRLSIFLVFAHCTVTCSAQQWSGAYSANLRNRYFGSTVCAVFADQTVIQQELDVNRSFQSGRTNLTATLWNSNGFSGAFKTYATETDTNINASHAFGKNRKYTLSAGEWMFLLNATAGTNVNVVDVKLAGQFAKGNNTLIPFAELQYYGTTNNVPTFGHGGAYPIAGATYTRKFHPRVSALLHFHAVEDANGGFTKKAGKVLFYGEAALALAVRDNLTITAPRFGFGGAFNDPPTSTYKGRPIKTIWGMGFTKTF